MRLSIGAALALATVCASPLAAADGNRLTHLDDTWNPYHLGRTFPKLVTPQWVGEEGVDCVITLGIDDMRGTEKWEAFLRPILNRLKRIDGRAPVSIMTCEIDPRHPQLQTWLAEGLSLETHTVEHPMPLFKSGDLARVKATYDRCVDLLNSVPGNRPVAFRVPACDSLNTPTPRFYANVFNRTTARGHFLELDSSVFNVLSPDDAELPREVFRGADGANRFRKYLPADRTFVNTVENYPYPYVLGGLCWELPCVAPSDWSAQHYHKPNNPVTVADWKAALDCCVAKRGTFNLVFHPHGWIRAEQVIDVIDYATAAYGKRVKFLTFRECRDRLTKNLLGGVPLRHPQTGADNGVRLLDLDNDGYLDVVVGNGDLRQTRVWDPRAGSWSVGDFPTPVVGGGEQGRPRTLARFGVLRPDGAASVVANARAGIACWHYNAGRWEKGRPGETDPDAARRPAPAQNEGDDGVRLRDLDGDGICELIVSRGETNVVFAYREGAWKKLPFALPPGARVADAGGRDAGLRFADVDEDGHADVLFSNEDGYGLYLWESIAKGWARKALAGKAGEPRAVPLISRGGADNGFWVHSAQLWWGNEDTPLLKDHVDRRSFGELLVNVEPTAHPAEASRRMLAPRPGFKAELVAAEPLVRDPVAFAWGPDGKLWVVEMGDYPLGLDGRGEPGGQVRCLEDTDGDGRYDKATVFLDHLGFPTGVLPWRKGVIVTCAPDVFYAEDTDGDGKADRKEVLFTGFAQGNQQHRVNTPMWGLDNWVYIANGDSGGGVRSAKTGKTVDLRGRDLRVRPDTGDLEPVTGQTQFGHCRDDWGNRFGGNNSNPVWHFALEDHYLRRNPHVAPPDPRVPISVTPGAARVYPVSRTLPRFNSPGSENHFTSACSPVIYRDELFGPAFAGNVFVSEPVHNLVHREVVSPVGSTFTSRRADGERQAEFLASRDNWFRPTTIRTGPDGSLWVADMYRAVIEHPEWIPRDWQKRLDLRAGHDQGRIYRVYPENVTPRTVPRLDRLDAAGLVAALDSPNGWQRDTAHMMLLWNPPPADGRANPAVSPLRQLVVEGKRPQARLHALCVLDGLDALTAETLLKALDDEHPGVRRHAVRLCEGRLAKSPELGAALVKRSGDPDAAVRVQVAYTLGAWADPRAGRALGRLLADAGDDRFLTAAALSSVNGDNLQPVLLAALERAPDGLPAATVENLLRTATGFNRPQAVSALLRAVATPRDGRYAAWQFGAMAGLLDALAARGRSLDDLGPRVPGLDRLFEAARATAIDENAPVADRARCLALLGRGPTSTAQDIKTLVGLLSPQTPDALQHAAVAALGRLPDPAMAGLLLRGWKGYSPALRSAVLDALLARDAGTGAVLDALEKKTLRPADVDAVRAQRLLQHKAAAFRERAAKVFAASLDPDRQKVIVAYQPVLALAGETGRGKELFARHCAACHRFAGAGNAVGPDLASLGDKSNQSLLIAVLDPNRAVEARYQQYRAETRDGRVVAGVLTAETGASVTFAGDDGRPQVLLRQDIESLASTGKSAMPEGLERQLSPQDLADVFAHLRAAAPAVRPKALDGNKPTLVKAGADGSVKLLPADAEIYGPTLVLEKQYGNLGYWSNAADHAAWEVEVPRAGRYAVWLDWACDNGTAGNRFELQALDGRLVGVVPGTGDWDTYKQASFGELALKAGRQRLVLRPEGPVTGGALIDLRGIRLVPVR